MQLSSPRPARKAGLLALLLLVLALAAPATVASAAGGAAGSTSSAPKPTVVLVHGAWADGSSWNAVVSRLRHDGFPVRVPPNPLRGVVNDSTTVANFLATVPGPIILVGHSYGGAVITNAATGNPNVKALVYVDAFAPAEGEKVFPLAGADSAVAVDPTTIFDFVPYPGAPAGDVDLYLKHDFFVNTFAAGVRKETAELGYATQRPLAYSAGDTASGAPAWATIPSWYLLGTQDTIITPTAQLFMAQRAHSTIVRVKAGHLSLLLRPDAVEKLVLDAARATR
jgi:pimeloyl-ACP methyl ester carboxylesterase